MSNISHSPTASPRGDVPPRSESEQARVRVGGHIALAIALLVFGLPLALVLTTIATLNVLAWSPSYQTPLSLATSAAVLVVTGATLWLGVKVSRTRALAGGLIVAASLFTAVTALLLTLGGLATPEGGAPPPTVVNASAQTVVVLSGPADNLHLWRTLAPGEHAQADIPPFATDGCYPNMWLEARTTEGRAIGSLFKPCTRDVWRITDAGAERTSDR